MSLFEGYERRIDKINEVCKQYGIASIEDAKKICDEKGVEAGKIVKDLQPIAFDNAAWAYTLGAAIAIKKGCTKAVDAAKAKLTAGELHVFDTSTFTVDGVNLTTYLADVDTDAAYTADTEVIKDGYFSESDFRSAPYFDLRIDGIKTLNEKF